MTTYLNISGQFHSTLVSVSRHSGEMADTKSASLSFPELPGKDPVTVYAGRRLNMATGSHVMCWFVHHDGRGLIEGRSYHYKVKDLMFTGYPRMFSNGSTETKWGW